MSDSFACGDTAALVSYLYNECEPEIRETIAAHVVRCASCAMEIDGLELTRQRLQAWTPPMPALGFRMPTPTQSAGLPWWRAPLPAWAQAVAAVLIFGVGLAIGTARNSRAPQQATVQQGGASSSVARPDAASRPELLQLEQRLEAEMARLRTAAPTSAPAVAREADIMKKVEALLAESEERQRREFTLRSVQLARDFETQRRVDLASVSERVGQLQGVTGAEIRQQREAIERLNNFVLVSQGR